jgi:hypothetical protein
VTFESSLLLVLGDVGEHLHGLLDEVLADDLENLVLLEGLTRDVEGKVLRVDDSLDKVEVLGDEVLAVVHDEDAANVELDVVALLLGLEEIEGGTVRVDEKKSARKSRERAPRTQNSPLGDEEDSLELELSLNREVLDGKVILPVVGERLVEGAVLLAGDVGGVASPERLGLVELDLLGDALLDLLGLLGLLLIIDLLDLGLVILGLLREAEAEVSERLVVSPSSFNNSLSPPRHPHPQPPSRPPWW